MKTSQLTGRALDYAVALAEGKDVRVSTYGPLFGSGFSAPWFVGSGGAFEPSTGPAGDDIIDREKISTQIGYSSVWVAHMPLPLGNYKAHGFTGTTRREAAMRAYVASKLGDEVEIPKELE